MAVTDVPYVVDVDTVARAIGKCAREVRRQCEIGVLPATKIGRTWAIAGEVITGPPREGPPTDPKRSAGRIARRTFDRMTTINTPEILATLAVLCRDNSYNASLAGRGDGRGKPDAVGTQNEAVWRAQAERDLLRHESDGVPDAKWRVLQRQDLLSRGDRLIAARVKEKLKKHWGDHKKRAEEIQRLSFKYVDDKKLSIEENQKRREEALEKHMHSHVAFAMAQHQVQTAIANGELSAVPSQTALEAEARAEIMDERPWLFAHLNSEENGGTAARKVPRATTVARTLLEPRSRVSYRRGAARTAARSSDVDAFAADLVATYRTHGASFPEGTKAPALEQAKTLARATLSLEAARRETFLSSIMYWAGIR